MVPKSVSEGFGIGLLLIAAVGVPAGAELPELFDTPWVGFDSSDYSTARYVYAGTVADFDNDGDPDVATATWPNIPRVTVLLNKGDGNYAPPDIYTLPKGSQGIISADFDGDGFVDLIASNTGVNYEGTTVSRFRNNGDGTFAPGQQFQCGSGPVGLAAADFDGDGNLDLAVANWGFFGAGNTVSLLLNNGDGSFAAPLTFPAGDAPYRLAAADFDGDGQIDLAVANGSFNNGEPARINLLFNDGGGSFLPPQQLPTFWAGLMFFPTITAADIDLDDDVDLLYSHTGLTAPGGFAIAVIKNLGDGQFAAPQPILTGSFTGGAVSIDVGDVTGDGWPDVFGVNLENEGWVLAPSAGGGNFDPVLRLPSGEAPVDIASADADGDGDLDVLVFNRDSLEVCVHINPGDGDFAPGPTYPTDPFSNFSAHGDLDNDGDIDALTSGVDVRIFRNFGDGIFAPQQVYNPGTDPLDIKLRDLNGDGWLDLLFNEGSPPYRWGRALNDGEGNFLPATIWPVPTCGYFFFAEIDAFDLDNDTDLDVVQIEMLGCPNIPTSGRRIFINENLGDGNFQLAGIIVTNPSQRSVAAADFNEDGNLDLVLTSQPTTILLGHGDLTFTVVAAANLPGLNVTTADFNNDGHTDFALMLAEFNDFSESMAVQLGNGDGTFLPPQIYPGAHSPGLSTQREIHTGDVDQDGDLDLMILNTSSNDLSVFLNNGDGTFQRKVRYGMNVRPFDFEYADFTGDGIGDVLALHASFPPFSSGLTVARGLGAPAIPGDGDGDGDVDLFDFSAYLDCVTGPGGDPISIGCEAFDFDGDGDADFADLGMFLLAFTGSE